MKADRQKLSIILKLRVCPETMALFVDNCPSAQLMPWLREILIYEVNRLAGLNSKTQKYKSQIVSCLTKDDAIIIGQLTSVIVFLRILISSKGNEADKYRRLSLFLDALDNKINAWVAENDN